VFSNLTDFKRPRFPSGIIFGLAIICLGVGFLLHNFFLIHIEDVLQYSPCVLIAFGLARLWNRGILNIWGQIRLNGGIFLQIAFLSRNRMELYWPVLLIWVGVLMVIKAFMPKKARPAVKVAPSHEHEWPDDWPRGIEIDIDTDTDTDTPALAVGHENEENQQ
jgi:putative Mn2+ efflux pump MntP